MEAGGVLLLLLGLWTTSRASFYGDSIAFATPKKNSDGTLTVGCFSPLDFLFITSCQTEQLINIGAARANQIRPRKRIELVSQSGYTDEKNKQTNLRIKNKVVRILFCSVCVTGSVFIFQKQQSIFFLVLCYLCI